MVVTAALVAVVLLPRSSYAQETPEPAAPEPPATEQGIFSGERWLHALAIGFDLVILRPLGVVHTAAGLVLFVPTAALSAADDLENVEEAWELFVLVPAKNVYERPLGDL